MKLVSLFTCLSAFAVVTAPPPPSPTVSLSTGISVQGSFDIPADGKFWLSAWLTGNYADSPKQFIDRMVNFN